MHELQQQNQLTCGTFGTCRDVHRLHRSHRLTTVEQKRGSVEGGVSSPLFAERQTNGVRAENLRNVTEAARPSPLSPPSSFRVFCFFGVETAAGRWSVQPVSTATSLRGQRCKPAPSRRTDVLHRYVPRVLEKLRKSSSTC